MCFSLSAAVPEQQLRSEQQQQHSPSSKRAARHEPLSQDMKKRGERKGTETGTGFRGYYVLPFTLSSIPPSVACVCFPLSLSLFRSLFPSFHSLLSTQGCAKRADGSRNRGQETDVLSLSALLSSPHPRLLSSPAPHSGASFADIARHTDSLCLRRLHFC